MSNVQEIERAIQKLTPAEIRQVAEWLEEFREELWDQQIDADIKASRLDPLWQRAKADIAGGRVKPLDEILNDE
jgi:hypothetical protein